MHGFFERWGTFAIFVCRFLPVLRGIAAIPAGIAEMNLALFYLWTFLGSLIFCTFLILLGDALGDHLDAVLPLLQRGGYVGAGRGRRGRRSRSHRARAAPAIAVPTEAG